jgi:hypothetical protein
MNGRKLFDPGKPSEPIRRLPLRLGAPFHADSVADVFIPWRVREIAASVFHRAVDRCVYRKLDPDALMAKSAEKGM